MTWTVLLSTDFSISDILKKIKYLLVQKYYFVSMHFVLLSTNFLESVIDSKIEYLIVLPMSYLPVKLSI